MVATGAGIAAVRKEIGFKWAGLHEESLLASF